MTKRIFQFNKLIAQKEAAENRKITSAEIAAAIGTTRTTPSNWRRGKHIAQGGMIHALMEYFDCSYDELFEEVDDNSDNRRAA